MSARRRSHWAWGWEDAFPDTEARQRLAERAAFLLGKELKVGDLPSADAVELPPPRIAPPQELRAFGTSSKSERMAHTYGKSFGDLVRAFHGDFKSPPDWVFFPETEEQVASLMLYCEREDVALVPYGGGTSVVGGVETPLEKGFRGVVTVSLRKLDRVLEISRLSRSARIQAGATGPRLEEALAGEGLTLRHFPQSFEFSTLGGWIATRAGGHFATLYTRIDAFVQAVRVLTPRGVIETRTVPSSGAGPSPEGLVLGSEGTLGIVLDATLRVHELPRWRASASVCFDDFDAAVRATRALAQSGLNPTNCRLLDSREAFLHRVADGSCAVLLVGFESHDHPLEPWMERALSIATDLGGECEEEPSYATHSTAGRASDAQSWRSAFIAAPYLQSALVSMGVVVDTFETCCTWDRFDALHRDVVAATQAALDRECGGGLVTCRFTHVYPDGPAPYYTFIGLGARGCELARWAAVKRAASDAILEAGGTITHHHSVGRLHKPWYHKERSPLFGDSLRAVKSTLDPRGILNPGVLL